MQLKPITNAKQPEYPTEYHFINNPELYRNYIPLRWLKNKVVCSALTAFVLAGTNNTFSEEPKQEILLTKSKINSDKDSTKLFNKITGKVAPIFVHGGGYGAIGCVIETPPVFISEEEAMKIIADELLKDHIIVDIYNCPVIEIEDSISYYTPKKKIKISGVAKYKDILIKYISYKDTKDYNNPFRTSGFVVNTKNTAAIVRDELEKNVKSNVVVFYDPLIIRDRDEQRIYFNGETDTTYNKSKQLLIAQVDDFIQWLKKEGIIH